MKAKQTRITQLEAQLNDEKRVRQTLSSTKESKINDLEKDIQSFVKTYADENEALKRENAELKQNKEQRAQELAEFKKQTAEYIGLSLLLIFCRPNNYYVDRILPNFDLHFARMDKN